MKQPQLIQINDEVRIFGSMWKCVLENNGIAVLAPIECFLDENSDIKRTISYDHEAYKIVSNIPEAKIEGLERIIDSSGKSRDIRSIRSNYRKWNEEINNLIKEMSYKGQKYYNMSDKTRQYILSRDGHQCAKCSSTQELQIHHIHHRENGGTDDYDNLVTLCKMCHSGEHIGDRVYAAMMHDFWFVR